MAKVTMKYMSTSGSYHEKSMFVSPKSTKLQRKFFDMNLGDGDDTVTLLPGTTVVVEVIFNNKAICAEIKVPQLLSDVARVYTDMLFCELHGTLVNEEDDIAKYVATKLHVNMRNVIDKLECEEAVTRNKTERAPGADDQRADVEQLRRTLLAKKSIMDDMIDTTKTYLKDMDDFSAKLALLDQIMEY